MSQGETWKAKTGSYIAIHGWAGPQTLGTLSKPFAFTVLSSSSISSMAAVHPCRAHTHLDGGPSILWARGGRPLPLLRALLRGVVARLHLLGGSAPDCPLRVAGEDENSCGHCFLRFRPCPTENSEKHKGGRGGSRSEATHLPAALPVCPPTHTLIHLNSSPTTSHWSTSSPVTSHDSRTELSSTADARVGRQASTG